MDKDRLEQEGLLLHKRICPALGDPKRLIILYILEEKGRYVNELAELLDVPQPTVSRHLAVLRQCGLVNTTREGPAVYYTLADHRIIEALDLMRGILSSQLETNLGLVQNFKTQDVD